MKKIETELRQNATNVALVLGLLGFIGSACAPTIQAINEHAFKMMGHNTSPITISCDNMPTFEISLGGGALSTVTARKLNAQFDDPTATTHVGPSQETRHSSDTAWVDISNLAASDTYGVQALIEVSPNCTSPATP